MSCLSNQRLPTSALLALATIAVATVTGTAPAQNSTTKVYGQQSFFISQPNGPSGTPTLSCDGSKLALVSQATNLISGDTNGFQDVFLICKQFPAPMRVSVGPGGAQANGDSFAPDLSATGDFVTFASSATNLVTIDGNGLRDVFVHDVVQNITERVSVSAAGGDPNGPSFSPSISDDGRFVAFTSAASNLVLNDTNGVSDVFLFDRNTRSTILVSANSGGSPGDGASDQPAVDGSGRFVAFRSLASNFVLDSNGVSDVFVRNVTGGGIMRVSERLGGGDANGPSLEPHIAWSGLHVSFTSLATNLIASDNNLVRDVFAHDLMAGTTRRASQTLLGGDGNGPSFASAVADNGKVTFVSSATNLVSGDTNAVDDIFVDDPNAPMIFRASLDYTGAEANDASQAPDITADGCDVTFTSDATNLVLPDTNGVSDTFVHRHGTCCLALQADPMVQTIGNSVKFVSGLGDPGQPLIFYLVAFNNVPILLQLQISSYDIGGLWDLSGFIPNDPALVGTTSAFQVLTRRIAGGFEFSNVTTLAIQ